MNPRTPLTEHLIQEWHPTKNGDLLATDVSTGAKKKVWWLGRECGHEWEAVIKTRVTNGTGCPYCKGSRVLIGFNDLATTEPKLVIEWHPSKNFPLTPFIISRGSTKPVWWICEIGHEWVAHPNSRSSQNSGCPYCSGRYTVTGFNDLETLEPKIALQWHPALNPTLSVNNIASRSSKKVWWVCKLGHEWKSSVASRVTAKSGCPICLTESKNHSISQVLKGYNDLETTHPEIASGWHPRKNLSTPDMFTMGSNKRVWWLCSKCGHEWEKSIKEQRHSLNKCDVCSNRKAMKGRNDLTTTHPEIADEWHPIKNTSLTVYDVCATFAKKVWWQCINNHEWQQYINDRTQKNYNCPYCSNKKVLRGWNDIATTHPKIACEWHPTKNENLSPHDVTFGSMKRVWWLCAKGHEWFVPVNNRCYANNHCPECALRIFVSKAEQDIADFITSYGFNIIQSDRKIARGNEIDIYIPNVGIAIEYNGLYWHTEKAGRDQKYHHNKWQACCEQDIQLIQIWEDQWERNPTLVKNTLLNKLGINNSRQSLTVMDTEVITITKKDAELFLSEYHISGFTSGSLYFGIRDKSTDEIKSVVVLRTQANKIVNIVCFADSSDVTDGFKIILGYIEDIMNPTSIIASSDHCLSDDALLGDNGFVIDKIIPPDFQYVMKGKRVPKTIFDKDYFKNDSNLKWQPGLTERELAAINNLPRIWDAGKTRWVKYISFP